MIPPSRHSAKLRGIMPRHNTTQTPPPELAELRPGQSIELLKALHILTRDGRMNQDSRRKLKQVYHLVQFIEPLLQQVIADRGSVQIADIGAGKAYLGFILYDLFFKSPVNTTEDASHIYGIEARPELVEKSVALARELGYARMSFLNTAVASAIADERLPATFDVVTALHACDTATDDAIRFALQKKARFIVLAPCCQAEVAAVLRKHKGAALGESLTEVWRHPLHTREFGSHLTNVLRCLQLEAHGYQVNVTELVGWEHSLKNELIIASFKDLPQARPAKRLNELLEKMGIAELRERFFVEPMVLSPYPLPHAGEGGQ
jgi:SAM-dependent methyltransferase